MSLQILIPLRQVTDYRVPITHVHPKRGVERQAYPLTMNPLDRIALTRALDWQAQGMRICALSMHASLLVDAMAQGVDATYLFLSLHRIGCRHWSIALSIKGWMSLAW